MVNVSKFVKEHTPLCVCTFGLAVLGYLGYQSVRWMVDKCRTTKKIDIVAQKNIPITLEEQDSLNRQTAEPNVRYRANNLNVNRHSDNFEVSYGDFLKKLKVEVKRHSDDFQGSPDDSLKKLRILDYTPFLSMVSALVHTSLSAISIFLIVLEASGPVNERRTRTINLAFTEGIRAALCFIPFLGNLIIYHIDQANDRAP